MIKNSIVILWLLVAILAGSNPAAAAIIVTNTNDSGAGSLRQAISLAMSTAAADTITFSTNGTITLNFALPDIVSSGGALTIDANGQSITISGNSAYTAFYVDTGGTLTLKNLAIGYFTGTGAIYNRGAVTLDNLLLIGNSAGNGGAVFNVGTLNVSNSTFSGNSADVSGAAIYSAGSLAVSESTFSGNTAGETGGGIYSSSSDNNITNSTFSGNNAATGGGIYHNWGPLYLWNCTLSGNTATSGGGIGVNASVFTVYPVNTIVAGNTGGNCSGPIINGGNNIDSGTTCGWGSNNGSMSNTDPLLGPLADNGGLTDTMALLPGSPAIDGVIFNSPNFSPATDQRGIARPRGLRYDIGAYEYEVFNVQPLQTSGGTVDCVPTYVEPYGDAACTITPTNLAPDNFYISQLLVKQQNAAVWTMAEPATKYTFADVTSDYYIQATFSPTNIWLYRFALFSNPQWEYQTTRHTIADALLYADLHYPLTDTIRIPSGALKEAGGVLCLWNVQVAFSGGWTSQTVRDGTNPMSAIAGPLTIRNDCALTMDGITVE